MTRERNTLTIGNNESGLKRAKPSDFIVDLILEAIPENEKKRVRDGILIRRGIFFLTCSQQLHFSKKRAMVLISSCEWIENANKGLLIKYGMMV